MTSRYLILNRLQVVGTGRIVYDETFQVGVNIIRGKNGSGKSTIGEMIFCVLGGESIAWSEEALQCDWVHAEIDICGTVFTLKREISGKQVNPVAVYEGGLDTALASATGWLSYASRRSEHRESFSQFMFQRLGLPESHSEESHLNVTMHQVLRLLYSDQHTDATRIFRREDVQFGDRSDLRKIVGEMLLGIDDLRGHEFRSQHLRVGKDLSVKEARLRSLVEAAQATDPNFRLSNYVTLVADTERELDQLAKELAKTGQVRSRAPERSPAERARVRKLEKTLAAKNLKIRSLESELEELNRETLDSEAFVTTLEDKLAELLTANEAGSIIGDVELIHCPICLSDLQPPADGHCPLCKSVVSAESIRGARVRYELELKHQIKESRELLGRRYERHKELTSKHRKAKNARNKALDELRTLVSLETRVDPVVSELLKQQGYLTRKLEDQQRMLALQASVDALDAEVAELGRRKSALEAELKRRESAQEKRRSYCHSTIEALTVEIAHQDVIETDPISLRSAEDFVFSFDRDFLSIRHGRLSASTQVFLKNSFHLALLKFGIEDEESRLPNFFLLDNIEDKGMVPERFQWFHQLLIEYSESVRAPHQVILTTSYIDSALQNSKYCVGPSYEGPPFTLDLKGEWPRSKSES